MNSLLLALGMALAYLVAYHTYGKYLSRKIFKLDPHTPCPSQTLQDGHDYVPTRRHILFGHHFTSIAGLGPIVGPSVAIIWGWVPAILWVLIGSIFMGAVHDFGALVVSLRHQGRTIGDLTSDYVNHRVRILFLFIIFFLLWIVIAVFGLIMGLLYRAYPTAVIPVWSEIPIAMVLGWGIYKKGWKAFWPSIAAVALMYVLVVVGTWLPVDLGALLDLNAKWVLITWIVLVLVLNAWLASSLPVQMLLQPRDFINSHQLVVAMLLLAAGVAVARPALTAPTVNFSPSGAPPMWPFLFVVIACGAISGFHSLVSSGTTSKQCRTEGDARFIGYGSMLMEGMLGTLVIVAVAGGLGMGLFTNDGQLLRGTDAFSHHYATWGAVTGGLFAKLSGFVKGAANMIERLRIPRDIAKTIIAVFIVSFAGTTVDSATRIQRYVIVELGRATRFNFLTRRQIATFIAVATAFGLAFFDGQGKGAMTLWPLFGCVNQLLGSLALLVITFYLARHRAPVVFTLLPMLFMLFMTGWAMVVKIADFYHARHWLLFVIAVIIFALEIWMIAESALVFARTYGMKHTPIPDKASS